MLQRPLTQTHLQQPDGERNPFGGLQPPQLLSKCFDYPCWSAKHCSTLAKPMSVVQVEINLGVSWQDLLQAPCVQGTSTGHIFSRMLHP